MVPFRVPDFSPVAGADDQRLFFKLGVFQQVFWQGLSVPAESGLRTSAAFEGKIPLLQPARFCERHAGEALLELVHSSIEYRLIQWSITAAAKIKIPSPSFSRSFAGT